MTALKVGGRNVAKGMEAHYFVVTSPAKRFEDAIMFYGKAIDLNSSVAAYYGNRSFAYLKMESYGFALDDASKALELDRAYIKVCGTFLTTCTTSLLSLPHPPLLSSFLFLPPPTLSSSPIPPTLHPSLLPSPVSLPLLLPSPSSSPYPLSSTQPLTPLPSSLLGLLPSCQCQHGSREVQAGLEGL